MGLVSGKVGFATGARAGIGRAAALKFADEGAKVVVSDLNGDGGSETVALIRQKARDAVFVQADVTDDADVEGLIASAVAAFGRLDCACNNAGIEGRIVPR
jgi:NAD(P)-dependent dehydrogenase (short-subunit alcohol dehydrogenase family)